ncbi:MAG: Biotin carboxyl carrier protein [candidate division Zixibacteria bacterium RBG-1]|nr:MAG: Biotin carboxyl carrier protein [candidate division Zixibacteria bacterium RBG-1]OGC85789.1 MAG: acetyl-CoA carboxylase, biotin carboxyl carrier protein [candidate division Zixibacteria bacterium RBG_19FT_COMBO_42_43]
MRESKIKKLIRILEESNIEELEIWYWGKRIRISKRLSNHTNSNSHNSGTLIKLDPLAEAAKQPQKVASETESQDNLVPIKSPMVGTFHRAPAPGAKPYIELNHEIQKGQVACIVEAMKLMNEIESDVSGKVVKICVENGKPVEYGQTLFLVEPSA